MTPAQIIKLFSLCERVLAVKNSIPLSPEDVPAEAIAEYCAPVLEENAATLAELRNLLVETSPTSDMRNRQ